MADRPAKGNTVARSMPYNDDRTKTEGGHEQKDQTVERSFDPRDLEIERLRKERDALRAREQIARAESEELHKRFTLLSQASKRFASSMRSGTSERQRYRRRLAAQYAVSRALEHSRNLGEAAPEILRIIGENLGWDAGVLWARDGNVLRCEACWQSQTVSPSTFEEACRQTSFARGEGLPGRVWARSEPVWAEDLLEEDPLREAVADRRLRGAIAFPVRDGGLAGVFEFFRSEILTPDEDLLQTAALVGRQIGHFVERRRAEAERDRLLSREREARRELSGILESISDAFFAVDREWRFTYVNRRAEELWSRSREDLLGKNLWDAFPQAKGSAQYREIHRAMEERTTTAFEAISPVVGVWVTGRAYPAASGGVSVYFDDVTERKRVEEALHESEERFRAIVSQATAGICRTDLGGRLEFVNSKMCELLGYQESELVGRSISELTHPDDVQENMRLFRRLAKDGTPFLLEKRLLRKDGSTIWANVSVSAIRDAAGRPQSAAAVVLDVTDRKQAEAELLALKDELDAELSAMTRLHELSTRLFATSELHPVLEEVLDASIQLQGADFGNVQLYDRESGKLEIVAHSGFDQEFLDYFRDTDENTSCGRALKRGERIIIEDVEKDAEYEPHRQIAASAGYRAVQSTPLFDRYGEPLGILSTHFRQPHRPSERELRMTDLYARRAAEMIEAKLAEESLRRSEERLRRAIGIETVGVIFFNADGQITDANNAFLRMSGYSREDLAEGQLRWDVMTPQEWMPRSLEAVKELKTTGRTTPYEKEYIRKDGSRWWGLFAATSLSGEENVEFIIDVTERKKAEEERERLVAHELTTRAQAEERRRLSRELHDRVAHDIALVHQSLELHEALKESAPERAAAKMQLARRTVKGALESTRDLSMELREQEVRRGLEAALANLLRDFVSPTVESSLSVEGDEALVPVEIRNQLFLILREAIRNVVTHSGSGRIAVAVDISRERVAGRVEDEGGGFDPDEVRAAGGLRAMSERAALVGGTLDVSSVPGGGTTVKVSVPLGDA